MSSTSHESEFQSVEARGRVQQFSRSPSTRSTLLHARSVAIRDLVPPALPGPRCSRCGPRWWCCAAASVCAFAGSLTWAALVSSGHWAAAALSLALRQARGHAAMRLLPLGAGSLWCSGSQSGSRVCRAAVGHLHIGCGRCSWPTVAALACGSEAGVRLLNGYGWLGRACVRGGSL